MKGSGFTLQNVYFINLRRSRQNKKQLKASIVSEEFYGLPAKCYGPQMSTELGIKKQ